MGIRQKVRSLRRPAFLVTTAAAAWGCGEGTGPVDATTVPYGQTTFVVVVNPTVNSINTVAVPAPGTGRDTVRAAVMDGPSERTDTAGVAALSPVTAGQRILAFDRDTVSGQVTVAIAAKDLREVAVSLADAGGAAMMANVLYAFGGRVVEVSPSMSINDVNARLAESNVIVFLRRGVYTGDLTFSGSNVTLYGEGRRGGTVTINGNVTVGGSGNRIRGAHITGNLSVPASDFGMSFSRVDGAFSLNGSNARLLQNVFCGSVTAPSSNITALGNAGMAPVPAPPDC